jgi:hypothetical protein
VDVAVRLLFRFSDIKMLLAEPVGGWTLSDLLPAMVWMGFEAGWAFVLAFSLASILHSYFSRSRNVANQDELKSEGYLNAGEENSSTR